MNGKIKLNGKLIIAVLSAICTISFFLPMAAYSAKISENKREVFMKYTGYRVLVGFNESVSISGHSTFYLDEPGSAIALLLIICPLVVLAFSFIPNIKQKTYGLITAICSALNLLFWLIVRAAFTANAKEMGSDVKVKVGGGLVLVIICSIVLIIAGIMAVMNKLDADAKIESIADLPINAEAVKSIDLSKIKETAAKVDLSSIKTAINAIEIPGVSWTCKCGTYVESGKFCPRCGSQKPEAPKCPSCGAKANEGDIFCKSCGNRIVKQDENAEKSSASNPICPSCGAVVLEGFVFCQKCGTKVRDIQ